MTEHPPLPPIKLAFILDGRIQEILNTDNRLAAIFLSQPIVVDISNQNVAMLSTYDEQTQTFTPPQFDAEGNLIG
jgi:hypothetical protein